MYLPFFLQLERPSAHSLVRTADPELERQRLRQQELGVEHIRLFKLGKFWRRTRQLYGIVGRLGREEQACRPASSQYRNICQATRLLGQRDMCLVSLAVVTRGIAGRP